MVGGGYKGALGTFGKLREYKGMMGIARLPTPLDQPPSRINPGKSCRPSMSKPLLLRVYRGHMEGMVIWGNLGII